MDYAKLWPHQAAALSMCRRYLDAFHSGLTSGSALVRMPTGTGKSGVIAMLAAEAVQDASCLIVTPWKALRDQIARDVEWRFWKHVELEAPTLTVKAFTPSTLAEDLELPENAVLACTHATLQTLHDKHLDGLYARLHEAVGMVLVDEGHREPAPNWARAVRGLKSPCVLFSATPYRNDQKLFNGDLEYATTLTYGEAAKEGFIRSVEFDSADPSSDPATFVTQLRSLVTSLDDSSARVIVRCDSAAEVLDIASRLQAAGETAIALHDTFPSGGADLRRKQVPDPAVENAQFWVHQFKLLEGIDDPRFRVLALYRPLSDARALVQQIGRVIRNPSRTVGQPAIVLAQRSQRSHWDGYLAFEEASAAHPDAASAVAALQTYLEKHSLLSYYAGNFREPFDPDATGAEEELLFRFSANVFDLGQPLDGATLGEALEAEYYAVDRHVLRRIEIDEATILIVFVTIKNSPLLRSQLFFEYKLGYTLVHQQKTRLFLSDSDGRIPDSIRQVTARLPGAALESLFEEDTRLGAISLINTDVGPNSVRRRTLHARSLGETAPNLFDHSFFPSTAWGYVAATEGRAPTSRYVGFTRSRVSDHSATHVTLEELLDWIRGIAEHLDKADPGAESNLFVRYASESRPPSDATALNVLLDISEVSGALFPIGGSSPGSPPSSVVLDDICYDVAGASFEVLVNGTPASVGITFDTKKQRYTVLSPSLDKLIGVRGPGTADSETLTTYLNREQSLRVVCGDGQTVYAHSRFYRPRVPLGGTTSGRLDLLKVFYPIDELAQIESEKGTQGLPDDAGWPPDSVFGLLDTLGQGTSLAPHMAGASVLVCDDMNAEVADFWLGKETDPTVALIHAKAGTGQRRSASVFHDLAAQALKNLEYISPFLDRKPPNYPRWGNAWKAQGFSVKKRVRIGGSKAQAWSALSKLIRNPTTTREVWLVLGAGFSAGDFEARVGKKKQPPEDVQVLYLLSALWSGVSAVGARLRIFCSP